MHRVPEVRVLNPPLVSRPGESLPHVFADGTLCLHQAGEWTPEMLIVDTTLPWTAEWLINYEIWKATGDWHGGGKWPPIVLPASDPKTAAEAKAVSPKGAGA
jgi:hypothetical protein